MQALQSWFQNLVKREQIIVAGGGIIVVLIVFIYAIWAPLTRAANNAKEHYNTQVALLEYMHQNAPTIMALRAQGQTTTPTTTNEPLLTRVEQSINNSKLTSFLTNIQQQKDAVNISFDSVPFDILMSWLQNLNRNNKVNIDSTTIKRLPTTGMTKVELTLK